MSFRVWEQIGDGRLRLAWPSFAVPTLGHSAERMRSLLVEDTFASPKIDLTLPAKMYWQSADDDWDIDSAFGPLRSPFASIWCEWAVPPRIFAEGEWGNSPTSAGFTHIRRAEVDGFGGEVLSFAGGFVHDGVAVVIPGEGRLIVDEDGRSSFDRFGILSTVGALEAGSLAALALSAAIENMVKPALLGISLMNCKNVSVSEETRTPKRRKNRPARPSYTYHVIDLPPSVRSVKTARTGMGGGVPVHITRGHFKTYTESAPLFGQHIGTWWWHDHIKGDPNYGTSAHDYRVTS